MIDAHLNHSEVHTFNFLHTLSYMLHRGISVIIGGTRRTI